MIKVSVCTYLHNHTSNTHWNKTYYLELFYSISYYIALGIKLLIYILYFNHCKKIYIFNLRTHIIFQNDNPINCCGIYTLLVGQQWLTHAWCFQQQQLTSVNFVIKIRNVRKYVWKLMRIFSKNGWVTFIYDCYSSWTKDWKSWSTVHVYEILFNVLSIIHMFMLPWKYINLL